MIVLTTFLRPSQCNLHTIVSIYFGIGSPFSIHILRKVCCCYFTMVEIGSDIVSWFISRVLSLLLFFVKNWAWFYKIKSFWNWSYQKMSCWTIILIEKEKKDLGDWIIVILDILKIRFCHLWFTKYSGFLWICKFLAWIFNLLWW